MRLRPGVRAHRVHRAGKWDHDLEPGNPQGIDSTGRCIRPRHHQARCHGDVPHRSGVDRGERQVVDGRQAGCVHWIHTRSAQRPRHRRGASGLRLISEPRSHTGGIRGSRLDQSRVAALYTTRQAVDVGQWRISNDTWYFALAPEIGVVLPVRSDGKWFINGSYNCAVEASDRTQSYFGFKHRIRPGPSADLTV